MDKLWTIIIINFCKNLHFRMLTLQIYDLDIERI